MYFKEIPSDVWVYSDPQLEFDLRKFWWQINNSDVIELGPLDSLSDQTIEFIINNASSNSNCSFHGTFTEFQIWVKIDEIYKNIWRFLGIIPTETYGVDSRIDSAILVKCSSSGVQSHLKQWLLSMMQSS